MKVVKILGIVVVFFLLARYFPVLYNATQFNDFVTQEAKRTPRGPQLRQALLLQAQLFFLPINASDIQIHEGDDLIQVNVDYKVPVDLFVVKHVLSFHASGAGVTNH